MFSPKQWLILAAVIAYSVGIWYVSSTVTEASYLKEKTEQQNQVIKSKDEAIALTNRIRDFEKTQKKEQKVIEKEVIREVEKPVYRECVTTDDGVRLIERAIDSSNKRVPSD